MPTLSLLACPSTPPRKLLERDTSREYRWSFPTSTAIAVASDKVNNLCGAARSSVECPRYDSADIRAAEVSVGPLEHSSGAVLVDRAIRERFRWLASKVK